MEAGQPDALTGMIKICVRSLCYIRFFYAIKEIPDGIEAEFPEVDFGEDLHHYGHGADEGIVAELAFVGGQDADHLRQLNQEVLTVAI